MILMALDHVRDAYSNAHTMGTDLERTWPALFFTRWVTHFCAPVFVFLAGVGARLQAMRGKSASQLSRFLVTRGAWLLAVELVWIHLGMTLDPRWHWILLQTLWAIGWSMIALSALVWLPGRWAAVIGVGLCVGHNLLDGHVGTRSDASLIWKILEVGGRLPLGEDRVILFAYPVLAWVGVMAAGFGFGEIFALENHAKRRALTALGLAMVGGFVVLRVVNRYGDPAPWSVQKDALFTFLSFLNCTKYPPSLQYLLMTLGPAILVLAWLDRIRVSASNPIGVFGRVPLFFYCVHFWVISISSRLVYQWTNGSDAWSVRSFGFPEGGFDLPVVYAVWVAIVASLYWPSRWYAEFKGAHPEKWLLSYL